MAQVPPRFEPTPAWPLCGDLYKETDVSGVDYSVLTAQQWLAMEPPCPGERRGAGFSDELQVPYGPRHLRQVLEYDWHRGIDIPTRDGGSDLDSRRPTFAIADGRVIECWIKYPHGPLTNSGKTVICDSYLGDAACQTMTPHPDCPNEELLDLRLLIEHERPGNDSLERCFPLGCYYSRHTHLSKVRPELMIVEPNAYVAVSEGEFLGLTGKSVTGTFNHLHFEIRSSTLNETDDTQREAINPLVVLPYDDSGVAPCADAPGTTCDDSLTVAFAVPASGFPLGTSALDLTNPQQPVVTVRAQLPHGTEELDLDRIEVRLSALTPAVPTGYQLEPIDQGPAIPWTASTTPENDEPWLLDPPFLDFQDFNRQYTYKDEGSPFDYPVPPGSTIDTQTPIPFSAFCSGGAYESPFTSSWEDPLPLPGAPCVWKSKIPDAHLTDTDDIDVRIGSFNGLRIWPSRFNSHDDQQTVYVQFQTLVGSLDDLCIEAVAYDIRGNRSTAPAISGPCAPPAPANAWVEHTLLGFGVHFDPVPEATFYRVWLSESPAGTPPAREDLFYEGPSSPVLGGRPKPTTRFAVEACYASAPSCGTGPGSGECPTAQCSPLLEANWL